MMRKLLFLLVMFPVCCMAQSKYCVTWQDFLDGQWREPEGRVELVPSSKDDALAMVVKAEKKKTAHILRRGACVMEYEDSLYLNLRRFNTFGDVYVQAWRLWPRQTPFCPSGCSPHRVQCHFWR